MGWRTQRFAEIALGGVLLACGAAALISTARMRVGSAAPFQPRLFPNLVGWLLIAAAALLAFDAFRASGARAVEWPSRRSAATLMIVLGTLAAHIVLIDLVGMPIATFFAVAGQVWYFGAYRWYVPLLAGLVASATVYFVFMYGLGLTLPAGPFLF